MALDPISTYRLQFQKEFTFENFNRIIPYLQKLGIRTVYASPVFESVPGSTHGYDTLNPHRINPEIGTEEQLKELGTTLRKKNIGWLQDIVPNHMAFSPGNPWLLDVLEKGPQSLYASFFDTALTSELYGGRMMVPFLGDPLKEVIEKGELKLGYREGRLVFNYFDALYPLNPASYFKVLSSEEKNVSEALDLLLSQLKQIYQVQDPRIYTDNWNEFLLQLSSLMKNEAINHYIESRIDEINSDSTLLDQLANGQIYRLCTWQETDGHITFRRFFTVNGLICLNSQDKEVFDHFHFYIKSLHEAGIITGLRVDHIDGLFDPSGYLERLRTLAGEDTYIVVEKILEPGENLPLAWPVQGTTGYDFLALVNNLLTFNDSEDMFTCFYNRLTGNNTPLAEQVYEKKTSILYQHMGGELDDLYHLFLNSGLCDKNSIDALPGDSLKQAIGEFLIQCPVYRYYGNKLPLNEEESAALREIFNRIRGRKEELRAAADLLEEVLFKKSHGHDDSYDARALYFYQRCMQFSGPLMAKGVEDTLMYTYNRFIAHNEVGDSPEAFGITADDFHQAMKLRQEQWPLSLNGTSTHDTKRGEDVRARLNVLTEMPENWITQVEEWINQNSHLKQNDAPDANDEYLIYQTLLGSYPMPGENDDHFSDRICNYIEKALREAKQHSNWTEPNVEYEEAAKAFIVKLLDKNSSFLRSFIPFHRKITDFGIINSLVQVTLKFTCPGVPDIYQGCDLWDLSLVDPDNRKPVDYTLRLQMLEEIEILSKKPDLPTDLWKKRNSGEIKLWLTHTLLKERGINSATFEKGDYLPLEIKGRYKKHLIAFARRYQQNWYIIAVPLHLAKLCKEQECPPGKISWKNTRIILPEGTPKSWKHLLLKGLKGKSEQEIHFKEISDPAIPIAILKLRETSNERGAGILMHITSLPSHFGIGDFGPEAKQFADFLARSGQKYWQMLPLSPTEQSSGNSPYSSYSSMAGNPLLISPELLASQGLLTDDDLAEYYLPVEPETHYAVTERVKDILSEKAYRNFKKGSFPRLEEQFSDFCSKEAAWLDNFALYIVLKQKHKGESWYLWPEKYKLRERPALEKFAEDHDDLIKKTRWLQFIFKLQWTELKSYCNKQGIQLFGDMPFYVSYDSADVWSHPDIFCLDEKGNMLGVAGVPPDYFNGNGQLWGMPVFRWDVLKAERYEWWIQRIRKNIELFDLLRFDHFRAFSAYWEVPAGEETAKDGTWKPGPGSDFFHAVQKKLGKLPFVAEDLGDIDESVYELRDTFGFPGMKVLQFAFGENMPASENIPHSYTNNSFVYTGTHDNNTTRGWYRKEADAVVKKNLDEYTGAKVKSKNVHHILSRLAYASVSNTVILPLQDVLGLKENARMNSPASGDNNWQWRLKPGQLTAASEQLLKMWVKTYGRG